jgi:hypothetical protein
MNLGRIGSFLRTQTEKVESPRPGVWHVTIDGVMILTIADAKRLRIMAPIFSLEQLESSPRTRSALMIRLLQANFDDTSDARYAIFNGIVFASITQPRTALRGEEVLGRYLEQVVNLHKNTFRIGEGAYSALPPHPESFEIDPRKDETLPYLDEGRDPLPPSKGRDLNPNDGRVFL